MAASSKARRDHYQEATDRIIEALEAGTAPWQQPWTLGGLRPCNGTSRRAYRGINVPMLMARGFGDPRWFTFNQAQKAGWSVRKGEVASGVYFYKPLAIPEGQARDFRVGGGSEGADVVLDANAVRGTAGGEIILPADFFDGDEGFLSGSAPEGTRVIPVLRSYAVFNAQQIDGVPSLEIWLGINGAPTWDTNAVAEETLRNIQEKTGLGWVTGDRAAYDVRRDQVIMPPRQTFASGDDYYAVAFHETGHATAHPSRLNRPMGNAPFGSPAYAREELRAELASMFLSLDLGLPHRTGDHAAYVKSWIKALREDKREIFRAATDAQRIADFVVAYAPERVQQLLADRYAAPATTPEPAAPSVTSAIGATEAKDLQTSAGSQPSALNWEPPSDWASLSMGPP